MSTTLEMAAVLADNAILEQRVQELTRRLAIAVEMAKTAVAQLEAIHGARLYERQVRSHVGDG